MAASPGEKDKDIPPLHPHLSRLGKPDDKDDHDVVDLSPNVKHPPLSRLTMFQHPKISQSPRPTEPSDGEDQFKAETPPKRHPPSTPRLGSSVRLQHITLPRTSSPPDPLPENTNQESFDSPMKRLPVSTSPASHPKGQERKVVAEVDYQPGDTIMRAPILFAALNPSVLASHCSGCFRSRQKDDAPSFLPCSRCKLVVFCSVRCYAQSAEAHFPECRALARCGKAPRAEVRLMAKALHARSTGTYTKNPMFDRVTRLTPPSLTETINDLTTLLLDMSAGARRVEWKKYKLVGEGIDGFVRNIGFCLAREPAQIGHSCNPNALFHFPEGLGVEHPIRITALQPISIGDEITISYLDEGLPCHLRTDILAQQGFEHDCHDCERIIQSVDMRYSTRHVPCPNQGLIPMTREPLPGFGSTEHPPLGATRCTGCHAELSVSEAGAKPLFAASSSSLESDQSAFWQMPTGRGDYRERIEVLSDLLASFEDDQYLDTLHPLPRMRHLFAALAVLCDPPNMDSLKAAMIETVKGYKGYREVYGDQARPVTVDILLQHLQAKIAAARIYEKELVEAKRRIAKRAKRRSEAKRWEPYTVRGKNKAQPVRKMESKMKSETTTTRAVKMERSVTLMGLDRLAGGDESSEQDELEDTPWSDSGPSQEVEPRATNGTLGLGHSQRHAARRRKLREIRLDMEKLVVRTQYILSQAREERLELLGRSHREDVMGKLLDGVEEELRGLRGIAEEAGMIVFD